MTGQFSRSWPAARGKQAARSARPDGVARRGTGNQGGRVRAAPQNASQTSSRA